MTISKDRSGPSKGPEPQGVILKAFQDLRTTDDR